MDWRSLPPLSALRAFAALAETRSFTQAGAALNVSHAAVSQQVRGLEERLGVALLPRDGRRGVLTPEGERLAAALEAGFGAIGRAVDDLTGADTRRPLQLTATPAFATSWLMPRLTEFRHLHPDIGLTLNPTPQLVELEPGGVDVGIRYGMGRWRGLDAELLVRSNIVLVGAPSLLAGRRITDPHDVLDLPWLQELGTSEMTQWLRDRGVIVPKKENVVHLPGYLVLEALRNGDGVSLSSRILVEPDIEARRLTVLFEDEEPDRGYYIVTRPGVQRLPLRAFIAWLRRHRPATPHDSDQGVAFPSR